MIPVTSKLLGDSFREPTKKLVVSYRMPKDMQVMNPQDQISRVVVKVGETTPKLKFDSYIFRARFGTEDEHLDVTSRVVKIFQKTQKFEVRADALGVHRSSHLFRMCIFTIFRNIKHQNTKKKQTSRYTQGEGLRSHIGNFESVNMYVVQSCHSLPSALCCHKYSNKQLTRITYIIRSTYSYRSNVK